MIGKIKRLYLNTKNNKMSTKIEFSPKTKHNCESDDVLPPIIIVDKPKIGVYNSEFCGTIGVKNKTYIKLHVCVGKPPISSNKKHKLSTCEQDQCWKCVKQLQKKVFGKLEKWVDSYETLDIQVVQNYDFMQLIDNDTQKLENYRTELTFFIANPECDKKEELNEKSISLDEYNTDEEYRKSFHNEIVVNGAKEYTLHLNTALSKEFVESRVFSDITSNDIYDWIVKSYKLIYDEEDATKTKTKPSPFPLNRGTTNGKWGISMWGFENLVIESITIDTQTFDIYPFIGA